MFFKLFICVLLVSHSFAEEEEDDGQYSPEKYEKPYEDVSNEQVDESLGVQVQQQSDKAVPVTHQQQQVNPQALQQQQIIPESYQQLQVPPQAYQQQQAIPQTYQQHINPLAYQQQQIKLQSYQQQQIIPQAYQQPAPQTLQHLTHAQSDPQAYNQVSQQQPAVPLTYQQLVQQAQSYQQNLPLAQTLGDQKQIQQPLYQQFLQQQQQKPLAVPQTYQQAAAVSQFYQQPTVYQQSSHVSQPSVPLQQNPAFPQTYSQNTAQNVVPNVLGHVANLQQSVFSQVPIGATNYQTDNGHRRSEKVDNEGNVVGQYSYIDPNGKTITVRYSAGKDGFRVEGDHLPKAPQVLPGATQSQIKPFVANLESQTLGIQAAPALNTQTGQNLHNQQTPQYNLQALYGQQAQAALGQPQPPS